MGKERGRCPPFIMPKTGVLRRLRFLFRCPGSLPALPDCPGRRRAAFRREAEAGQLVHGVAVILVAAGVAAEIKPPHIRRVLLYASELRHVRRSFLCDMLML